MTQEYPRDDGYLPEENGNIMRQHLDDAAGAAEDAQGQVNLAYDQLAALIRSRERNPVAILETVMEQVIRLTDAKHHIADALTHIESAESLRKANSKIAQAARRRER